MIDESVIEMLKQLLDTPARQPVDGQLLKELTERYPSFTLPAVIALRHPHEDLDESTVARMIESVSLSLPDPTRLRILIDPEGTGRYDNFYPATPTSASPTTDDAIDTFLSTYGNIDPAEEALLQRMIFNPVPDYAATLERDVPQPAPAADEQDRLLDAFIARDNVPAIADDESMRENHTDGQPACDTTSGDVAARDVTILEESPVTPSPVPSSPGSGLIHKAPTGSLLSESLAKIFIKQHNYRRAYEIISSLSLNYPEKSIYFADQLRFLHKLIANQEARERQNKARK